MTSDALSSKALEGFSKASQYDTHRPSYPSGAVATLLENLGITGIKGAIVVDLAAGTGKFTEVLAARPEEYNILAVEPHPKMREELVKKNLKNVTIKDGLSVNIPVECGTVSAVVAAQAFHWFSNLDSLKEINRVLKPGGRFGMIWNAEDYNQTKTARMSTVWESKLHDLMWTFDDRQPRYRHEQWKNVFHEQKSTEKPLFSTPLQEGEEKWIVWLPKEDIWHRFSTISHIAILKGEELEKTHERFEDALSGDDVEYNENGAIALHGTTIYASTTKLG